MNLAKEWRTFSAVFRRNLKMFASYKASVLATIVWPIPILGLNIYQYLGLGSSDTVAEILSKQYGVSSFSGMIIIGTIIYLLYNRLLWGTGYSIRQERWQGTIEALLLTPASRITILLASGLASFVEGAWWIVGVFFLSWGVFGLEFHAANWIAVGLALGSTMLALVAVGVFFASFFILTRSADLLATSLQAPIRFFGGVAFPVAALPQALQFVAYALPVTYGIEALRKTVLAGGELFSLVREISLLYAFAITLILLGYALLRVLENHSKKDGSLYMH